MQNRVLAAANSGNPLDAEIEQHHLQNADEDQVGPFQPGLGARRQAVDQGIYADVLAAGDVHCSAQRGGIDEHHHGRFAATDNGGVEAVAHDDQDDDHDKDEAEESPQKPRQKLHQQCFGAKHWMHLIGRGGTGHVKAFRAAAELDALALIDAREPLAEAPAPAVSSHAAEAEEAPDVPPPAPTRRREAEITRRDILDAAMEEFAAKGLSGARVDAIAARTRTTKPMIYYHFGSKEKLYAAVMEEAYGGVRSKEQGLHLDELPTEEALRRLVEVTFDHHAEHPEYVRLVTVENIEMGRHITGRKSLIERNAIAIETVRDLLRRGEAEGTFRSGINPWHLHFLISSYCFMRVSNRYSWRAVFDMDLWDEADVPAQREMIVDAILRYVRP